MFIFMKHKNLTGIWLLIIVLTVIFVSTHKIEAESGTDSPNYQFIGNYNGNASVLFFLDSGSSGSINFDSYFTNTYEPTLNNSQDLIFTANSIEITANQMTNGSGTYIIGSNETAKENISSAYKVAQQFSIPHLSTISTISLYLEYNFTDYYHFKVKITEEDLNTTIEELYTEEYGGSYSGWTPYTFQNNFLEPGKTYYIVFEVVNMSFFNTETNLVENNFWKAELHNSSIYDKGSTFIFDGANWNPIQNDSWRDMLCYFDYTILVDPTHANFRLYLNNTLCDYIKRKSLLDIDSGYEVYYTAYFQTKPTAPINVTILLNTTIEFMSITIDFRYIYIVPAITGWFTASPDKINWTLIYSYPYVADILSFSDAMFAYELDWDYYEFSDDNTVVNNLYVGPIKFYGFSGYAAFPHSISTFQRGNVTGKFTSPNYCNIIIPKVKINSEFQTTSKFELEQTVRLEASIKDREGNPISGGNGLINFTSPSGQTLSFSNLTSINGTIITDEFYLGNNFETGLYTVSVFWTNGREVGCYIFQMEVSEVPAAPSNFLLYLLIGITILLATISSLLILKTKGILWGKGPINIFISHKAEDYEPYKVKEISEHLQKKKEVGTAFYFEEHLVGNIDDWMKETIPISQILLFIATKQSINSRDCQYEIKWAKEAGIDIIPIKGTDLTWDDLNPLGLDRQKGIPFPENREEFITFLNDLHYYVKKFKQEMDVVYVVLSKSPVSDLNLIQLETNLSPEKIWRFSKTLIQLKKLKGVWTKDKKEFLREDEVINRINLLKKLGKIKDFNQIRDALRIHEEYLEIFNEILKSQMED
mgnify:CR=1 FL=1